MEKVINIFGTFFDLNVFSLSRLLIAIVVLFSAILLKSLVSRFIIRLFGVKGLDNIRSNSFYKPLKSFFVATGLYLSILILGPSATLKSVATKAFRIILILLVTHGVSNLVAPGSKFEGAVKKKMTKSNDAMIKMICKFLRIFVYILGILVIISELGFNINGIIAGIGIGSAALALAAQDTASNIIGAFMIMIDKPFEVGEWIKIDTVEGAVEEFTFRSTRIRQAANCVVAIPNSTVVNSPITNWSRIQKRRIGFDIVLEFNTPLKKIADLQNDLLILFGTTKEIIPDSYYVKFDSIKDSGYNLKVQCFTSVINYMDYLAFLNDLNFKIMNIMQEHKVTMAYNTQTLYIKK